MLASMRRPAVVWGGMAVGLAAAVIFSISPMPLAAQDDKPADHAGSSPQKGKPIETKDLSLDQAHAVLAAAVKKADELKVKMDIAVVDAGGNLKGFARMD